MKRLSELPPDKLEKYNAVKEFIRRQEKHCYKKLGTKVKFRKHRFCFKEMSFVYIECEDGVDMGRVQIKLCPKRGTPYIHHSFMFPHHVRRALRDLTFLERLKVMKSERHWRGAHS